MSTIIHYSRFWMRRDTPANWASANPVLHDGEIGVALAPADSPSVALYFKIGDGITAWNDLPVCGPGALEPPGDDAIPYWNFATGQYRFLTLGANLTLVGDVLDSTGGGGGISDGDYGDITVSAAGTTWTLNTAQAGAHTWAATQSFASEIDAPAGVSALYVTSGFIGGETLSISHPSAVTQAMLSSVNASYRAELIFQRNAVDRWTFAKDSTAESGGNAGANFYFRAHDDSGASLGNVFTVDRASRILSFDESPTAPTAAPGDNSDTVATTAFVQAAAGVTSDIRDVWLFG